MSTPRIHHYFPQFHLRHFANADGLVFCYDKKDRLQPNPKALPPISIAAESRLYDNDHPDAPAAAIEQWLAEEVDGPAAAVLTKILELAAITAEERGALARYVISRDLRVPRTRDVILRNAQAHLDSHLARWLQDPERIRRDIVADGGPDMSPEEIVALGKSYAATVTKGFWLDFMQKHTLKAAHRLLAKGWALFRARDDCQFMTSDLGILKHRGSFDKPVAPAMGWSTNADGWTMPLTPRLALAMAPGLEPHDRIATPVYTDRFNTLLVAQAPEFAFSQDEDVLAVARHAK